MGELSLQGYLHGRSDHSPGRPHGEHASRKQRTMSTQLLEFNPTSPLAISPAAEGAAAAWMARGACAQSDPNIFFPHDGVGVEIAKTVCADCRVTSPCLEYALANRIEHGVWGGCSERQRRRILRDRRAAARSNGLVAVAA